MTATLAVHVSRCFVGVNSAVCCPSPQYLGKLRPRFLDAAILTTHLPALRCHPFVAVEQVRFLIRSLIFGTMLVESDFKPALASTFVKVSPNFKKNDTQ